MCIRQRRDGYGFAPIKAHKRGSGMISGSSSRTKIRSRQPRWTNCSTRPRGREAQPGRNSQSVTKKRLAVGYGIDRNNIRVVTQLSDVLAPRDGLLAAAPLVLRCAADRRRAARVTVQLARRRSSCRTGLVLCRRFELNRYTVGAEWRFSNRILLAPRDGFEPPTNGLTVRRSTTELPGNTKEARIVGKRRP
jgi:hypothetical protein